MEHNRAFVEPIAIENCCQRVAHPARDHSTRWLVAAARNGRCCFPAFHLLRCRALGVPVAALLHDCVADQLPNGIFARHLHRCCGSST